MNPVGEPVHKSAHHAYGTVTCGAGSGNAMEYRPRDLLWWLEWAPRHARRTRILATNERMRQILCDQQIADVLSIHRQAPAWQSDVAPRGTFGAGGARARDHLQIEFVAAADD